MLFKPPLHRCLQYVRGASLERKMRLPPAETGYKRKPLTMNSLFKHNNDAFRRKLCILFFFKSSLANNWPENQRKQQKHRWNFIKPYRVQMRWDRLRRISKSPRPEQIRTHIHEDISASLTGVKSNLGKKKDCSTVRRWENSQHRKTCRNNKSSLRGFFLRLPKEKAARPSGNSTKIQFILLHQSSVGNYSGSLREHSGSLSSHSTARWIPSRIVKAPMTDRPQ